MGNMGESCTEVTASFNPPSITRARPPGSLGHQHPCSCRCTSRSGRSGGGGSPVRSVPSSVSRIGRGCLDPPPALFVQGVRKWGPRSNLRRGCPGQVFIGRSGHPEPGVSPGPLPLPEVIRGGGSFYRLPPPTGVCQEHFAPEPLTIPSLS